MGSGVAHGARLEHPGSGEDLRALQRSFQADGRVPHQRNLMAFSRRSSNIPAGLTHEGTIMGVKDMTIDTASIEAALFRSTGVVYAGMQYGPANDPTQRAYNASGKGRGHVYMHGADLDPQSNTSGPAHKSR